MRDKGWPAGGSLSAAGCSPLPGVRKNRPIGSSGLLDAPRRGGVGWLPRCQQADSRYACIEGTRFRQYVEEATGTNGMAPEIERKRLLRVTAGNLRNSHLYVNGHYDFFPRDCIGGPKRSAGCRTIEIHLDGLDQTISTDIGCDAKTGKPRPFFRARGWARRFFEHHGVKPGDFLALERLSERAYRLSVEPSEQAAPLECAEFFAGIGLVRLAREQPRHCVGRVATAAANSANRSLRAKALNDLRAK
jgi:hypothetical protein